MTGLRLRPGEITNFSGSNNKLLEEKILAYERLLKAYRSLTDANDLHGTGWGSAKQLAARVFIPLVKLHIRYAEALMHANSKAAAFLETDVTGSDEELDEATLENSLRLAKENLSLLESSSTEFNQNRRQEIEDEKQKIQAIEKKLSELRSFDAHIKTIYDQARRHRQRIEQALSSISGKTWNAATGRFSTTGINLGWQEGLDKYWHEREQDADKVAYYRKWFGMDRTQARLLAEFDRKFGHYAKEQGWTAEQQQYEYCRLLASTTYGGQTWRLAAGVHTGDELSGILAAMGFAEDDRILFGYAMRKQSNGRDSAGFDNLVPHEVGFAHMVAAMACILKVRRDPGQYGSVAYEGATVGSRHVSFWDDVLGVRTGYFREAATFAGDVASGSLPFKDMTADMDAINLTDRIEKDPDKPVGEVIGGYYRGVHSGKVSRVDDFLTHYSRKHFDREDPGKGYDFVESHLDDMLATPGVMSLGEGASREDQEAARDGFLRFLRENKSCYGNDK